MIDIINKIQEFSSRKNFSKNETIFMEGELANGFYFVEKGEVSITKISFDGKEIEIERVEEGKCLGLLASFSQTPHQSYAKTTKASSILYFSQKKILPIILSSQEFTTFFFKLLGKKGVALNQKISIFSLKTVKQRIAQYLTETCPKKESCQFKLPTTKTDLALKLGTINETLSRNLTQMEKEGLINVKGRMITINNCVNLKKCFQ